MKKFSEDKLVDIETYTDEDNFREVKAQIVERHAQQNGDYYICSPLPAKGNVRIPSERDVVIVTSGKVPEEEMGDVVGQMEKYVEEEKTERIMGQVSLTIAGMQLQNIEADRAGERREYDLDDLTWLGLYYRYKEDSE